jgi:hypothetical protein
MIFALINRLELSTKPLFRKSNGRRLQPAPAQPSNKIYGVSWSA